MNTQTTGRDLVGRSLAKSFGPVRALNGVDITVPSGQSMAIMGPSGSGKSTLLHCLSGILPPTAGEVTLGGLSVSNQSDAERSRLRLKNFGFVFQDGQLVPELPANENVALPLLMAGANRRHAISRANEWLTRLGLSTEIHRRPGDMSGGQAQRVAIARALAVNPSVVFADEPTGALDQATGHEVMQALTTTLKMSGATLILVTHDPKVAAWCDRLVEIRDGRIHADSAHPAASSNPAASAHPAVSTNSTASSHPAASSGGAQ